jgi:hypothetical protein
VIALFVGIVVSARAADAPPTGAAPPAGSLRLGLNEAVGVPRRLLDEMNPDALAAHLAGDAALARAAGAVLVRGHTGAFPPASMQDWDVRGRDAMDAWVRAVQAAELEPVAMIGPWPGNHTRGAVIDGRPSYLPPDMDAYASWVRGVVERYDADGLDDMPGLGAPVRWWEVDNEPDLKARRPPRDASPALRRAVRRRRFCTPAEYGALLVVTADAIHAASPDARVLAPGLYAPHAPSSSGWLAGLAEAPGARDAIDVLTVHTYADDDGQRLAAGITAARALFPDAPVWVTETGRGGDAGDASGAAQARAVVGVVAHAGAAGASAVLWHTLQDLPAASGSTFATHGLYARGRDDSSAPVPKPAADVYRHLAAVLRDHDPVGAVPDGDGAHRLPDGSALLWSGTRVATNGGVDLRTGAPIAAGATVEAPAWLAAGTPSPDVPAGP